MKICFSEKIHMLAGCVKDIYPTGLKAGCRAEYSCPKLARRGKCHQKNLQAMPKCRGQLKQWWKTQLVKNHCKKSCKNCLRKRNLFIIYVDSAYISYKLYKKQCPS